MARHEPDIVRGDECENILRQRSLLPQCIAETYAAQLFNERRGQPRESAYGVVTTGNVWRFLRLRGTVAEVDLRELHMHQLDWVLGVLLAMTV